MNIITHIMHNRNHFWKKTAAYFLATSIMLSVLTIALVSTQIAEAQTGSTISEFTVPEKCNTPVSRDGNPECGWKELVMLGSEILKFAIFFAILGATVTFTWAGFKMLLNQGSDGEIKKAKEMIWTATKGLIITMIAWIIVDFILDSLGVTTIFRQFTQ